MRAEKKDAYCNIRLSSADREKLDRLAEKNDIPVGQIVRIAIKRYLSKR